MPATSGMQEIASAVQVGARAYLNRQYMTVALAGLPLLLILGFVLDWAVAGGFFLGAAFFRRGGLYRHERLGAGQFAPPPRPPTTE